MKGPDRLPDETMEEWEARMERDWPETLKTLKIFQMLDENERERGGQSGSQG